jgi:hypothetical protein
VSLSKYDVVILFAIERWVKVYEVYALIHDVVPQNFQIIAAIQFVLQGAPCFFLGGEKRSLYLNPPIINALEYMPYRNDLPKSIAFCGSCTRYGAKRLSEHKSAINVLCEHY